MRYSVAVPVLFPLPRILPLLVAVALCFGCALPGYDASPRPGPSFRLSSLEQTGDPARRASNRLLLEGLGRDAQGLPAEALSQYERALQVDPNNPYAYLVLARHHAEGLEPARALAFLDRADALLGQEASVPPGVEAHVMGLRGAALRASGRADAGHPWLAHARAMDPEAWGDARLSARELR